MDTVLAELITSAPQHVISVFAIWIGYRMSIRYADVMEQLIEANRQLTSDAMSLTAAVRTLQHEVLQMKSRD